MKRLVCIEYKNIVDFEEESNRLLKQGYTLHTCSNNSINTSAIGSVTVWNAVFILNEEVMNDKFNIDQFEGKVQTATHLKKIKKKKTGGFTNEEDVGIENLGSSHITVSKECTKEANEILTLLVNRMVSQYGNEPKLTIRDRLRNDTIRLLNILGFEITFNNMFNNFTIKRK